MAEREKGEKKAGVGGGRGGVEMVAVRGGEGGRMVQTTAASK